MEIPTETDDRLLIDVYANMIGQEPLGTAVGLIQAIRIAFIGEDLGTSELDWRSIWLANHWTS